MQRSPLKTIFLATFLLLVSLAPVPHAASASRGPFVRSRGRDADSWQRVFDRDDLSDRDARFVSLDGSDVTRRSRGGEAIARSADATETAEAWRSPQDPLATTSHASERRADALLSRMDAREPSRRRGLSMSFLPRHHPRRAPGTCWSRTEAKMYWTVRGGGVWGTPSPLSLPIPHANPSASQRSPHTTLFLQNPSLALSTSASFLSPPLPHISRHCAALPDVSPGRNHLSRVQSHPVTRVPLSPSALTPSHEFPSAALRSTWTLVPCPPKPFLLARVPLSSLSSLSSKPLSASLSNTLSHPNLTFPSSPTRHPSPINLRPSRPYPSPLPLSPSLHSLPAPFLPHYTRSLTVRHPPTTLCHDPLHSRSCPTRPLLWPTMLPLLSFPPPRSPLAPLSPSCAAPRPSPSCAGRRGRHAQSTEHGVTIDNSHK
ncbi:unnamed protein product [Closterium sp. Naga37s-1]|nr:unnamed protein product [Closterium sp. Naga37s-1]CAI5512481.1 unnamed protein product [Closterium sp. Naga37s-1]